MDRKEILQNGSSFLLNCFRDAMDKHYEEEMALAVARQKEEDVCCAIAAFLELKRTDPEIIYSGRGGQTSCSIAGSFLCQL